MKRKGRTRTVLRLILPSMLGATIIAGASLLFAYFMQLGMMPIAWDYPAALAAVLFGACAVGMTSEGIGKRGILSGTVLAMMWSAWKSCCWETSPVSIHMLSEIALCILISWGSSCIFHKNKQSYTKRNRRRRRGR